MIFVEIFHDFGWFFATRIRFFEADPDPADQNETDRNGSGSATLGKTLNMLYHIKSKCVRICIKNIKFFTLLTHLITL